VRHQVTQHSRIRPTVADQRSCSSTSAEPRGHEPQQRRPPPWT
jgi:hypothetical protein